ncbi:MAG: hypothetical protein GF311_07100 [Candidatus Lokiarchaeota archaeon]|nr:hypothetical protein [Candidatus Lokiarchaeota archaeon]
MKRKFFSNLFKRARKIITAMEKNAYREGQYLRITHCCGAALYIASEQLNNNKPQRFFVEMFDLGNTSTLRKYIKNYYRGE